MAPRQSRVAVLIADEDEIVRLGLRVLFERTPQLQVVGETADAAELVALASQLEPKVVLTSVLLAGGSGIDACREIVAAVPHTHVLFLTSCRDEGTVVAAVLAGASGYLLKGGSTAALIEALTAVAAGETMFGPHAAAVLVEHLRRLERAGAKPAEISLSPQEERVLELVATGRTNKEIAATLDLSEKTVKNYLGNLFQKLRITRRSQAAALHARRSASH